MGTTIGADGNGRATDRFRIRFRCTSCGRGIRDGDECLILRVIRGGRYGLNPAACASASAVGGVSFGSVVRLCAGCAGEEDTLAGHLDMIGARYFSGPAEEAEGWESLGR